MVKTGAREKQLPQLPQLLQLPISYTLSPSLPPLSLLPGQTPSGSTGWLNDSAGQG